MGQRLNQYRQFERSAQAHPFRCALASFLALLPVCAYVIDGVPQADWLTSGQADFRRASMALLWFIFSGFWARLAWRGWRQG